MALAFVKPTQQIEKVMAKNSLFQKIILAYYTPIVKREVKLADIQASNNVLCVGGGYFPCTAILIHKFSKANVTVIDIQENTIKIASERVCKLGYGEFINVIHQNGKDIPAENFDVIHIAVQVSPKKNVFENLINSAKNGAKIIVRVPKKILKSGYNAFDTDVCEVEFTKQLFFSNIGRSSLYVK